MPDDSSRKREALCQRIKPVLQEIDEAACDRRVASWFRQCVHEAAEYARWAAETEARLKAEKEAHAREILKDWRAGGAKYTDGNNPPAGQGWRWDHFALWDEPCPEDPDFGWFPPPSEPKPRALWDTPSGSAALLALLHDDCLIDELQRYNPNRIVTNRADDKGLIVDAVEFIDRLEKGPDAAGDIAERWELVQRELGLGGGGPAAEDTQRGSPSPQGEAPKGPVESGEPEIPARANTAHAQYLHAAETLGTTDPTDREAYDALAKVHSVTGEADDLPSFATWRRNLTEYRTRTGTQKKGSRAGCVDPEDRFPKVEDIEPQSLPGRVRPGWADK